MSRLNPRGSANPAKMFAQWGGDEGILSYYDKEAKENVELKLPFTFLVVDELNTVKGWSDADHSGYWSNEVYDITTDELRVRTKRGLVGKGTWAKLKGELIGAAYCKSIYIAYKDETGELVLGNLQLKGAALTAWIEFNKQYDVYKGAVQLVGPGEEKKKGKTVYYEPVFKGQDVSADTEAAALEINRGLDEYLKTYFKRKDDVEAEIVAEDFDEADDEEEAPAPKTRRAATAPAEEVEEKPIDLAEVPF